MILISIKKRADFLTLSKTNIIFHSKSCLILSSKTPEKYLINPHNHKKDPLCRLGITITKKVGNAVIRNKIKRVYRQIFANLNQEGFTEKYFDYSLIAKKEVTNSNYSKIYADIKFCLKNIKRLIRQNEPNLCQT